MIITVHNRQKDLPISVASLKKMIPFLLEKLEVYTDEIILHFVAKPKMGKIHETFFSDPSPTDCMSFPIDPPLKEKSTTTHHILGEIFVCPQIAIEYAAQDNLDPHLETTLYVIHGLLHLLGYDDLDPISRKAMRKMEKKCLKIVDSFSIIPKKTKKLLS